MPENFLKTLDSIKTSPIVASLFLFAIISLVFSVFFVHYNAKSGTQVSLFNGFVTYTKKDEVAKENDSYIADTSGYVFQEKEHTHSPSASGAYGPKVQSILDKSINLTNDIETIIIGGAEIEKVSIAARDYSGFELKIRKSEKLEFITVDAISNISIIELKYKGNYFSISVMNSDELPNTFSVNKISQPTLTLLHYAQL